jgi:hypothetical protein
MFRRSVLIKLPAITFAHICGRLERGGGPTESACVPSASTSWARDGAAACSPGAARSLSQPSHHRASRPKPRTRSRWNHRRLDRRSRCSNPRARRRVRRNSHCPRNRLARVCRWRRRRRQAQPLSPSSDITELGCPWSAPVPEVQKLRRPTPRSMEIWVSTRSISRGISNAPFAIFEQSSSAVTQLSPAREVAAGMGEGRLSRGSQAAPARLPRPTGETPSPAGPTPWGLQPAEFGPRRIRV